MENSPVPIRYWVCCFLEEKESGVSIVLFIYCHLYDVLNNMLQLMPKPNGHKKKG